MGRRSQEESVARGPLSMTAWREVYAGGSPEAEGAEFEDLAQRIMSLQRQNQQLSNAPTLRRTFHAKTVFGTTTAELRFCEDLAPEFRCGFAEPGKRYDATVRLSNAEGASESDAKPDLRGIAVRVDAGNGQTHDLLATNFPVSHARNARQFVYFAQATSGGAI